MILDTPMTRLLNALDWQELPAPEGSIPDGVPVATHEGVLRLGELSLRVYQLSDGQRIISAEDMEQFFGVGEGCA